MKDQQFLCPFSHLRFYNYDITVTDLHRYSSYRNNFTTNLMPRLHPQAVSGRQTCFRENTGIFALEIVVSVVLWSGNKTATLSLVWLLSCEPSQNEAHLSKKKKNPQPYVSNAALPSCVAAPTKTCFPSRQLHSLISQHYCARQVIFKIILRKLAKTWNFCIMWAQDFSFRF